MENNSNIEHSSSVAGSVSNSVNAENSSKEIQITKKMSKNVQTTYDYLFKIALIGDAAIGKSSILIRFTDNDFKEDTSSTIGVDFKIVSISLGNDVHAKMQIW